MQKMRFALSVKLKKAPIILGCLLIVLLILSTLFYAKQVAQGVRDGIDLSLGIIIPSLFPFMVISNFIMRTKLSRWLFRPIDWLISHIFGVEKSLAGVVILSLIGGYPIGPKLIADLRNGGRLTVQQAERLLCFCVNCGPAFLIGTVAVPIFQSIAIGGVLFVSQLLGSITVAFLTRKSGSALSTSDTYPHDDDWSVGFVGAVNSAAKALFVVCSFIIIFSAFTSILTEVGFVRWIVALVQSVCPASVATPLVVGLLEVSRGCSLISPQNGLYAVALAALLTGFGGFCVHLQIKAIVHGTGIKLKRFYLYRLPYMLVSTISAFLLTKCMRIALPVFAIGEKALVQTHSVSYATSIMVVILCFLLLLCSGRSVTIKKREKTDRRNCNGR